MTIFVEEDDGRFSRFSENHYQRGYEAETMVRLIKEAGMEVIEVLDADTHEEITPESERIYIIAKEVRKEA